MMEQMIGILKDDMDQKRKRSGEESDSRGLVRKTKIELLVRTTELEDLTKLLRAKKDLLKSRKELLDDGVSQDNIDEVLSKCMFDGWIEKGNN
mmetsp:Transcript_28492/g.43812  ORF Transcript_28492/g.43812 Transcript_28492/m.43812 type:complete len:93 (-) Transcript_28492:43-321(-)